jgi:hypothetical protein
MSVSIRISQQASKVLAMESRSTGSDATVIHTVIHMRLKKSHARKPSFYSNYSSKVQPLRYEAGDEPCVINIINDTGGAKAPWLICEGICEGTTTGP